MSPEAADVTRVANAIFAARSTGFRPPRLRLPMDGKGRLIDNLFIERLWRSVKYEDIYLRAYENGRDLQAGLTRYFDFYNRRRIHQSHDYQTPDEIYCVSTVTEPLAIAA
jgi:transposase InsO family protein